LWTVHTVVKTN